MNLSNITKLKGTQRKAKRIGRGIGSGKGGHTSSRGQKGQKSRSGFNLPVGFEGGQVPMYKRMPHSKGFVNPHDLKRVSVNVVDLNIFEDGQAIVPNDLVEAGIINKVPAHGVKVLGHGNLEKKLMLSGFIYSESAAKAIEKLGGQAK